MVKSLLIFILACTLCSADAQTGFPHDRTFWREVILRNHHLLDSKTALPLALELAAFVTSTDPELRDNFGYEILANWIHRSGKFSVADLEAFRNAFVPHAQSGLGETGTDSVFTRSFALLNLKELAAADLKVPFLTAESFAELVAIGVVSLTEERDSRGYVAGKGLAHATAHATAHAAELARILGRNPKLSVAQQSRLIEAIAVRTGKTASVFAWGEDARLAGALTNLASRADADMGAFEAWFAALRAEHRKLGAGPFDPAVYASLPTQANTLSHFAALLARQSNPTYPAKLREERHLLLAKIN